MNLEEKIDLIKRSKDAIKLSIIRKGVTPRGNISTYANAINDIPTVNNQNITITNEGTFTCDPEYSGFGTVNVQIAMNNIVDRNGKKYGVPLLSGIGTLGLYDTSLGSNIDLRQSGMDSALEFNLPLITAITTTPCTINGQGLSYLENVNIPNLVQSSKLLLQFSSCQHLQTLNLKSLSTIERSCSFSSCSRLESVNLSGLMSINGNQVMSSAFSDCRNLENINLSNLTTISGNNATFGIFHNCTSLRSIDLSKLATASGQYVMSSAFDGCTSLTSVDLSSLTTISGSRAMTGTFYGCASLTNVDLSSLTTIASGSSMESAFQNCTSLTSMSFPNLTTISGIMHFTFRNCTNLTTLSFLRLQNLTSNNVFYSMLQGVTGCTVHFPSNLQSVIGLWEDVQNGFGGTNTTVLFDLPATT